MIPNPWSGLKGLPREAWVLFTATLINRSGTMVLPFLVLYLVEDLRFPAGRAGLAVTLYGTVALVGAPLFGRLCDRVGPLHVMRLSLFSSAAVLLVFPAARSWNGVLAATALFAATNEAFRPASLAILSDLVPPHRLKAVFALNRLAINLGMSIGPAVGGFLAGVSFRALFWVDATTSILAGTLLALALRRPVLPAHVAGGGGPAAAGAPPSTGPAHTDRRLLLFLVALVPVAVVFFQHAAAMPLFLVRDLGLRESVYGLVFTLNTLLIVLVEVQLNTSTAHWPHGRTLALGAVLCALGFGSLAFARGVWGVAATTVVWTFGEMTLFPGASAYVAEIAPAERRGEYMGLYMMAFGAAFSFGPWLGTEILERLGGRVLWGIMFVLGAVSAAALAMLRPQRNGRSA